jgi:DNA mismatch repair protein MutL
VVKELIENALDAKARRVSVSIEFGGKRLIRVEDDGEGMDPDDARLSIERHATSKIARADDLARIATLGFRGEALPSIASVSHFTLRTRRRGTASGTELRVNAGSLAGVLDVGMPEGTSVEVADVFYNLPARRKFLKSDAAESAQVSRIMTQLALCCPDVGFTLTSSGRKVLQAPPVGTLRDRLYQLYGERNDLVEVRRASGDVRITGFAAALGDRGPTRGPQNLYINRRIVKDRTIAHAIIDSYSVASIKERSPEVHLFLEMPLDAVDVNVHPTKAEVRFRDQSYVHEVVRRALADALGSAPAPELQLRAPGTGQEEPVTLRLPHALPSVVPSRWTAAVAGTPPDTGEGSGPQTAQTIIEAEAQRNIAPGTGAAAMPPMRPMIALGQFRDTFIIAVDDEGIAIVDQHVAHERVLFERVMERLATGRLESQRLLEPMLVEMSASGRQALAAHAGDLDRLGFEVEGFGGSTVRISAIPALLRRDECGAAIVALADDLEGLDRGSPVEQALKRIAATMACHAAVKANYPLTAEKMAHILDELRRTSYSTVCPHGRPVMLRLTRREVEKNFQRI